MRRLPIGRSLFVAVVWTLTASIVAALGVQSASTAYLMELPGQRVDVRYAGGSLDRAANLQRRFELMLEAASRWTNTALQLQLVVVDRDDWGSVVGRAIPYGVPTIDHDGSVVVAAQGDQETIALWHGALGLSLPRVQGMPLIGTREEVASLAIGDLLAQLDVARVVLDEAQLRGATPQIEGLLVMATAWNAWGRFEPDRLNEIGAILTQLASAPGAAGPAYSSFVAAARMLPAARQLLEASGHRPLRRLAKLAESGEGTVTACALLKEYDGLRAWQRTHSEPALDCRGE